MSGVVSINGDSVDIAYFVDDLDTPRRLWLPAVVVWRRALGREITSDTHALPEARALAAQFREALQAPAESRDAALKQIAVQSVLASATHGHGADGDGAATAYARYSATRRLVRTAGREFSIRTDGDTLVLLVDGTTDGSPVIVIHRISAPVLSQTAAYGGDRSPHARTAGDAVRTVYAPFVEVDPTVRAFLDACT